MYYNVKKSTFKLNILYLNIFSISLDIWNPTEDPTDDQIEETIKTITETILLPILVFAIFGQFEAVSDDPEIAPDIAASFATFVEEGKE